MGTRDVLRVQPPFAHVRETDPRMATWMEIVSNFQHFQSSRRPELLAALLEGVPGCLRGRVWELLLFSKPFAKLHKGGFAELVDTDSHAESAERTLEQIGNDVGEQHNVHVYARGCFTSTTQIAPCRTTPVSVIRRVAYGDALCVRAAADLRCARRAATGRRICIAYCAHTPRTTRSLGARAIDAWVFLPLPDMRALAAIGATWMVRVCKRVRHSDCVGALCSQGMNFITATLLGPLSPDGMRMGFASPDTSNSRYYVACQLRFGR